MSVELTHICDRCGARHTGDRPPLGWHSNVTVENTATNLPSYSPYYVSETLKLLCDVCMTDVSEAIKAALAAIPPKAAKP